MEPTQSLAPELDPARLGPLGESVHETHLRTLAALSDGAPSKRFEAVAWASAHLAAVHRVVLPLEKRHLGLNSTILTKERLQLVQIQRLLRRIERHLSGDSRLSERGVSEYRAQLSGLLKARFARESDIAGELEGSMTEPEAGEAAAAYQAALANSPTRPHPHTGEGRHSGRVLFRLNALRDHVLDVLDSRPAPNARPKAAHLSKRQIRNRDVWTAADQERHPV